MTALTQQLVPSAQGKTVTWVMFLHGILGSGANWYAFGRALTAVPGVGALLVDLPGHGRSQPMPPPHTLEAVVDALLAAVDEAPAEVAHVVGHSFGGKVATLLAEALRRRGRPLRTLCIVDAPPGPFPDPTLAAASFPALRALRAVGPTFPTREACTEALVAAGQSPAIAQWLGKNLQRAEDGTGYRMQLDLDVIEALLRSHFATDLWPLLSGTPLAASTCYLLGGRSDVVTPGDRARLARLAEASGGALQVEGVPTAGHWVHVDAPDVVRSTLLRLIAPPAPPGT